MKALRVPIAIIILGIVIGVAGNAWSECRERKQDKLAGVAVSRCIEREVALKFDRAGQERTYVIMSDADGRKLYEALKPYYEGKGGKE